MVNFNSKLAITQLVYEISSRVLGQIGGFTGRPL